MKKIISILMAMCIIFGLCSWQITLSMIHPVRGAELSTRGFALTIGIYLIYQAL